MRATIIRVVVTVIMCAIVAATVEWSAVVGALGSANPVLVVVTFAVAYFAYLVGALKWRMLLAARGIHERTLRLFRLNLLSMFYSFALPGQVAGESVKALRIARGASQARHLVASIFVDRLTGLVGVLFIGAFGLVMSPPAETPAAQVLVIGTALLIIGTIAVVLVARVPERERTGRVGRAIRGVSAAVGDYRDARGALIRALSYSILFQLLVVLTLWLPSQALGLELGWWELAWVSATVSFAQMVPLTIAGLGPREGTLIVVLAPLGISSHDALAFSLLIFATNASMAVGGALGELFPDSCARGGSARAE